jgi:hypothetical protein
MHRKLLSAIVYLAVVGSFPVVASAAGEQFTDPGRITEFGAGWVAAMVSVKLDAPYVNPGNCADHQGYSTDPADPGSPVYHASLLAALLAGKQVRLVVRGCIGGIDRPRIIGVYVIP